MLVEKGGPEAPILRYASRVKNMLFEVEFVVKENGHFETIQTALVYALTVTECRRIADEMASEFEVDGIQFFISEL
ncbi:hypothetical protein GK0511 [Geobacillus kaustophilus HTA426]|uniref:Uncharacterized protein n=1 Tax=Geobacillus kaustophilus (strain HTA426) TaxID=235909 RepID=Q5L2N4_GEOKA|nr:hypothetical protein GK0511 [Geobacillus kaustophilus HTA426]